MKKNNFKIVEIKSKKNKSTIRRTVLIKDFIINEIIGIHKHEKINKQKIIFARNMSNQSMERFQILMRYLYANSLNPSIIDMRNKSGAALKYGN